MKEDTGSLQKTERRIPMLFWIVLILFLSFVLKILLPAILWRLVGTIVDVIFIIFVIAGLRKLISWHGIWGSIKIIFWISLMIVIFCFIIILPSLILMFWGV